MAKLIKKKNNKIKEKAKNIRNKITTFLRKNKDQLIYYVIILSSLLVTYYVFSANSTFDFFKNIFQNFITTPDAIIFLYVGVIFDLIIFFYYIGFSVLYRKIILHRDIKRKWIEATLILIFLSGILGSMFLIGFMSHDLSSILRDNKNTVVGEINCTDSSGHFLANNTVKCTVIQPDLLAFSVKIMFTLINGTTITEDQNSNISFISPYDTKRVEFNIFGIDKNFNGVSLSTGRDFEFYTESQYTERNGQFLTYLAGLIAIILITIPSAMANFKKLCEK